MFDSKLPYLLEMSENLFCFYVIVVEWKEGVY